MSAGPAGGSAEIQLAPGVRGITAFALALGTFMQVLDSTIANVSLPTIAGSLGVSPHQGVWVITSFGVANGVSVPLTGWLMQRYGIVRTFATCVLLFTAASFLCGIAWSFESLIAFRVLQGAVSGPLIPGSQALLLAIFPYARRGTALAIWSMTTLVAPVLGPILGGYISAEFSWPWIFLMNVPVGLLSASVCWTNMRRHELPTRKVPVDRVGLVLLVVWIGALQVMLDTGKDADWFASTRIVVLGLVALVGFVAFLIWELTERNPIVDLTLFWRRNFGVGVMVTCLAYGLFFANVVILPLWLQTQLGYTSTWAGLVIAPAGIAALVCTPFVGRSVGRVDPRIVASIAFLAFGASYYLRAQLNSQAAYSDFVLPLAVQGVGMAAFFVPMVSIMLDGLPVTRIPSATGISNFVRITAGAFSASVITSIWDDRAALHQSQLADASSVYDPVAQQAVGAAQAIGFSDTEAVGVLTRGLVEQAYMLASLDIFWVSAWIPCVLFLLIWLTRRPTGTAPPTAMD